MAVDLLLFDLDDTLLCTSDLDAFRGSAFLNRQPQDYLDRLTASYRQGAWRTNYTQEQLLALQRRYPGVRLGVFTRSPRHYAETLLELAYPGIGWATLVAREDVRYTKPSGEGIRLAMRVANVAMPQNVWLIGDGKADIQAAYDAGCWCVLDTSTWPRPRRREDWWALERMPDAIISDSDDLVDVLDSPHNYLPAAERLQVLNGNALPGLDLRFEKANFFNPLERGTYVPIHFLGRHFSREAQNRVVWHQVTNDIHQMKDSLVVPDYWIESIRAFLRDLVASNPVLFLGAGSLVVTVVPAKPARVRRLEAMLGQLAASHAASPITRAGIQFLPDLMMYTPGVQSQHAGAGLNRNERFENVRDHLQVIPGTGYAGKHVVVIDDVATSGASLVYAHKYLRQAGASQVTCLALTKALSNQ
jgi:phosphoglycolate phosphatase-like HAD superfamily hydrolase